MRQLVLLGAVLLASGAVDAQQGGSTIYKHVDERGNVTYTNLPVKGGVAVDVGPYNVMPAPPKAVGGAKPGSTPAVVTPGTAQPFAAVAIPSVDQKLQRTRDDTRRRILEEELKQEEQKLLEARGGLEGEEKTWQALKTTIAQMEENKISSQDAKKAVERSHERMASMRQAILEHERNLDAIKKELAAVVR